ncbi:MAG: YciI family protein [Saprospiraceae bacterium]
MKEFLLLFWNTSGDGQYQVSPEEMKAQMESWQSWIGNIAMTGNLISTKPIQFEGTCIGNNGVKNHPAIFEKNMVTGYLLCKAKDKEEVSNWAATCPILKSPEGFTEIREISPFEI